MGLLEVPGEHAVDVLGALLIGMLEEEFGDASQEELEEELERVLDDAGDDDLRVAWLRERLEKATPPPPGILGSIPLDPPPSTPTSLAPGVTPLHR